MFIEGVLVNSKFRKFTDAEIACYRKPFLEEGVGRMAMLTWPREIPIEGKPQNVWDLVERYTEWLEDSDGSNSKDEDKYVPGGTIGKLFINAEPGSILIGKQRERVRKFKNQEEITVRGKHFIQEDSWIEIGDAVARFVMGKKAGGGRAKL
jgi:haloalkane dehalogenase